MISWLYGTNLAAPSRLNHDFVQRGCSQLEMAGWNALKMAAIVQPDEKKRVWMQ